MSRKSQETIGRNGDIPAMTEFRPVMSAPNIDLKGAIMASKGTVIVTGGSQGIGAAIVQTFMDRGYSVVATSRKITQAGLSPSPNLALVDGDISHAATAQKAVETAVENFGSIDALVNNAGIFTAKPFTEYTIEDFRALVSTNLEGYI